MISRLAFRSLTAHPVRSGVPVVAFGAGVAVMAILLGVAQIVLQQAQSPDLVGGGDVVIRVGRQIPAALLLSGTLQTEALHGWAISERIQQISEDVLQINQGSLYPALHRLEHQGWIEAEWAVSELGRRAKYYKLTGSGRRQLAVEAREWERMSASIGRVMKLA